MWKGTTLKGGYGQIKVNGKRLMAHRFFYELLKEPIPEGLTLDHLCRVTACVNPAHLEPVTGRENSLRGTNPCALNARKTQCKNGHPLSGVNLYIKPIGSRICRTCSREEYHRNKSRRRGILTNRLSHKFTKRVCALNQTSVLRQ